VPSVITEPIMSSKIMATWPDSATISRDTLDTCVVQVADNGTYRTYSIDMVTGTIIGFYISGSLGTTMHMYFYSQWNGIYFLRKACTSYYDTTIDNGGYIFTNIRLNDSLMSPVREPAPAWQPVVAGRGVAEHESRTLAVAPDRELRILFYDMLGRGVYRSIYPAGAGGFPLTIDRACPADRCRSGTFLVRIEQPGLRPLTSYFSR
jgi:hypothetical protein